MSKKFLALALAAFAIAGVASAATATDMGMTTLKKGSRGMYVSALQSNLNSCAGTTLSTDGAFGSGTAAAVMSFQASKGLKADGFVGAATKAAINAACGSTTTSTTTTTTTTTTDNTTATTTTPGCTAGAMFSSTTGQACTTTTVMSSSTEGNLASIAKLGLYNNTKVNEGAKDVKVYAIEMTAKDGDQKVDGFQVAFKNVGSGSTRFTRVASEISIWLDGKEIGRKLASSFSNDVSEIYTYRFSGMDGVVKMNAKSQLVVAVTPVSTFDSADVSLDNWSVIAGTSTGTPTTNYLSASSTNGRFRDFGDALAISSIDFQKATGEATWKVTSSSANPLARTIQVSKTADTNEVTLLAFDVKAENAAMLIQKLPVSVSVTNPVGGIAGTLNAQTVIKNVKLYVDGSLITSESAPSATIADTGVAVVAGPVLFGNSTKLQKALASNAIAKVEIKADIASRGVTAVYDEGTIVSASYTTTNLSVELDNFNRDTVTVLSGAATGENQTLRTTGVQVTAGTATFDGNATTGGEYLSRTVRIPVSIKAFDDTMYVKTAALKAAASVVGTLGEAVSFVFEDAAGATKVITSSETFTSTDATIESGAYRIDAGSTKNFILTAVMSGTTGHALKQYRVQLNDVNAYTNAGLTTGQVIQSLTPSNTYETSYTTLTLN